MSRAEELADGWLLIATDAYEAGFGKGEQAYKTGREVDNPWGDEPGRGAWAIGYAIGKERAALASTPAPAQQERKPMTYREIADATGDWAHVQSNYIIGIVRAVERHHGIFAEPAQDIKE